MDQSIASISGNVYSSMLSLQESELDKVDSFNYSLSQYDENIGKIDTDFEVTLKEIKPNSKVFLILKDDKEGKEVQLPLTNKVALTYTGNLKLSIDRNYEIQVVEELEDGGKLQLNYVLFNAYLGEQFSQNRILDIGSGGSIDKEERTENRTFIINSYGIEALEVDKIILYVLYRGATIDNYEITNDIFSAKSLEELDEKVVAASTEALEPEERPYFPGLDSEQIQEDMFGDISQMGPIKPEFTYYMYSFKLNYQEDYKELNLTQAEAGEISTEYHIHFKDGSEKIVGVDF
jgi:hypothetical protein